MKIPVYSPQVGVASGFPSGGAPPVDPTGAALQDVGTSVTRAGTLLAQADEAKRQYQATVDATRTVSSVVDQLDQAETTLKQGQRDPSTGEIITAPATPQDYLPAWIKARDQIVQSALDGVSDPLTKLATQKLLETPLRERQHQARGFANDLFVGQYTTGVEQELFGPSGLAQRAVTNPDEVTPSGQNLWESRALSLLASARGAVPEAKLREWQDRLNTQVALGNADRRFRVDPEGVISDLRDGKYALAPDQAERKANTLETRWATQVRANEAEARRQWEVLDKWWTGQQQAQLTNDYIAASSGQLTLDQLQQNARDWHYSMGQTKELTDVIKAPPKDAPSDPATKTLVFLDVNGMRPSLTEEQIKGYARSGALNVADTKSALDTLVSRKNQLEADARARAGEGRAVENQQRSRLGQEQAQAEQLLKASLGIPDILPIDLRPEVAGAYQAALANLTARSSYFPGGKEAPLDVVRDLIPRAQAAAGQSTEAAKSALRVQLPPTIQTPQQLEAARPTIGEANYQRYQDVFTQLKALGDSQRAASGGAPAAKPAGGRNYSAAAEKAAGRNPGQ